MLQRLLHYIHAILQFYVDLFLFGIENGFINSFSLAISFLTNQKIIKVNHKIEKQKNKFLPLYYNSESYHRITLHHVLHAYKQMNKLIDTIPLQSCEYILDLGANCGHFSVVAAEKYPNAKVYAFEPSPTLHPILNKNIGNRNIELVAKAVSDSVGTTKFHINFAGQQTNSILVGSVETFNKDYQTIEVPLTTLDAFVSEKGIKHVDILKIDCQGVESMILSGGENMLNNTDYLLLEITFLDNDVQGLLNQVGKYFPYHKLVNAVMLGADLVFSKKPL
jgi:FkbM family methyltransferase